MFLSRQKSSAAARVRVVPRTKRRSLLPGVLPVLPVAAVTSARPQRPKPTIAARIIARHACATRDAACCRGENKKKSEPSSIITHLLRSHLFADVGLAGVSRAWMSSLDLLPDAGTNATTRHLIV